jgi:hypothetical protein
MGECDLLWDARFGKSPHTLSYPPVLKALQLWRHTMKKLGLVLVCLFMVGLVAQMVEARPDYKKAADAKWDKLKVLSEEKCNFCHFGKTKKNRNDLGKALMKCGLSEEKYAEMKSDKEKLAEFVTEVLTKVEGEKSSKGGKTFGDVIKAGEDPSTDPEVEEE